MNRFLSHGIAKAKKIEDSKIPSQGVSKGTRFWNSFITRNTQTEDPEKKPKAVYRTTGPPTLNDGKALKLSLVMQGNHHRHVRSSAKFKFHDVKTQGPTTTTRSTTMTPKTTATTALAALRLLLFRVPR